VPPDIKVRQHTFDELEESLCELGAIYESREEERRACREAVIRAKDRAKWAARNRCADENKRRAKAEMVEWMLVWLGDPAMFPAWVKKRRDVKSRDEFSAPPHSMGV
jgi:hypothetical protein